MASSIIHFTRKFDTLDNILSESSFRLHYCREQFYLGDNLCSSAAHPMVSFSEQALTTINRKYITYGKFGVGLKMDWVKRKKLHPVLYIDNNSNIAAALSNLLKARRRNAETELAPHVRLSIMTIKCFTKNAIGYNSYFGTNNFNFKAEKEWRYVPQKSDINGNLISQTQRLYEKRPNYYNNKLGKFSLQFTIDDIECVFVETEKQRSYISDSYGIVKKIIKISNWSTNLRKPIK